jgi:hypothetical protein
MGVFNGKWKTHVRLDPRYERYAEEVADWRKADRSTQDRIRSVIGKGRCETTYALALRRALNFFGMVPGVHDLKKYVDWSNAHLWEESQISKGGQ